MRLIRGHLKRGRRCATALVAGLCTLVVAVALPAACAGAVPTTGRTYPIVDTGQHRIYSSTGQLFTVPRPGQPYYGEDGQYNGNQPRYRDNGDGTVTDLVTGLMWQKNVDYNHPMTYAEARQAVSKCDLGGHHDWRIPSIEQLYSLINYRGHMLLGNGSIPFIDTRYFNFEYGRASMGQRKIDTQTMSSTIYVGTTMHHAATQFGVNFADGRIKGYPLGRLPSGRIVRKYYRFVRGNQQYGRNHFVDNGDGTVSDLATGLMWARADSTRPMNWEQALAYCNRCNLAGHHDWRLPNAKELQSIVDYNRAPDATDPARRGPAINPVFEMADPQGWEWTSTTHLDGPFIGTRAVYIAFGEATGYMRNPFTGRRQLLDVHGAGAQRSDPKSGNPRAPIWAHGFGPQGDVIRIYNYVRPVRNIDPGKVRVAQPDLSPVPHSQNSGHPPQQRSRQGFRQSGRSRAWGQPSADRMPSWAGVARTVSWRPRRSGGLMLDNPGAFDGYTLFSPMASTSTYLVNNQGHVVHTWTSRYHPGLCARLLANGDLLRACRLPRWDNGGFRSGGAGGLIQERDWSGHLIWSYRCAGAGYLQNHDVAMLPNGDVLTIIWQRKTRAQAIAAGRNPAKLRDGALWPDSVIEIRPTGKTSGRIVWRWNLWDHLIQDYDPSKANYGDVAQHPELLNVNCLSDRGRASRGGADWTHANSIAYNPQLDQVLLSFRNTSEIYVIDHSTTTAQAAGHSGGRYGRGGDFLYRWGDPANYGGQGPRTLVYQHDASWIPKGLPGAGHLLVFNNQAGLARDQRYSNVLELALPHDGSGSYRRGGGGFAPARVVWKYQAIDPEAFYSSHLGSAQRLANGDTLIDSGVAGIIFEVTPAGKLDWEYRNPYGRGRRHSLFDAFRYGVNYPGLGGM